MNKKRLFVFVLIGLVVTVALVRGIMLGDPADMRMEASGL